MLPLPPSTTTTATTTDRSAADIRHSPQRSRTLLGHSTTNQSNFFFSNFTPSSLRIVWKLVLEVLLGSEDDRNHFRPLRAKLFELSRKTFFGFHVVGVVLASITHKRLVQIANCKRHWTFNELNNFFWYLFLNFLFFYFLTLRPFFHWPGVTLRINFLPFFPINFGPFLSNMQKKLGGCSFYKCLIFALTKGV